MLEPSATEENLQDVPKQLTLKSYVSQLEKKKVDQLLDILSTEEVDEFGTEKSKSDVLVQLLLDQFGVILLRLLLLLPLPPPPPPHTIASPNLTAAAI